MTQAPDREIAALEERFQNEPGGRLFAPLADAYRKTGNLARARAVVEQGLLRHPAYATGHVIAGWVFRDSGDDGSALQAFVRALELDPDNVVALRNLAELEDASGQTGEAVQHYRRLLELGIDDATVVVRLKELSGEEPQDVAEQRVADEPEDLGFGLEEVGLEGWNADASSLTIESEPAEGEAVLDVGAFQLEEAEPAELSPEAGEEVKAEERVTGTEAAAEPEAPEGVSLGALAAQLERARRVVEMHLRAETEAAAETVGERKEEEEEGELEVLELVAEDEVGAEDRDLLPAGEVLTQTMGDLYAQQGLYDRALMVYNRLLDERPDDAQVRSRLEEIELKVFGYVRVPAATREKQAVPPPAETAAKPGVVERAAAVPSQTTGATPGDLVAAEEPAVEIGELEEEDAVELLAQHWASGPEETGDLATPFAWPEHAETVVADEAVDEGPSISAYFERLLSWTPAPAARVKTEPVAESTPPSEAAAAAGAVEEIPEYASTDEPRMATPVPESVAVPPPPPAAAAASADELFPWEIDAEAPATAEPTPAAEPDDEALQARGSSRAPAAQPGAEAAGEDFESPQRASEAEDDDLETFRDWLKSLRQ